MCWSSNCFLFSIEYKIRGFYNYLFLLDLGLGGRQYSPEILAALQSVQYIAQHIKDEDKDNEVMSILFCSM